MLFVRRNAVGGLISFLALAVVVFACLASAAAASPGPISYARAANNGAKQLHRWWVRGLRWYSPVLGGTRNASLWQTVPIFEAYAGLELAQPSGRHLNLLNWFAANAERFRNDSLQPVPGFGNKPDQEGPTKTAWFDDNGWWGLAFLDAYRATGNPDYLTQAEIAQNFISVAGWDSTPGRPGGLWWNTNESFYAGETLASGTLLSARLYGITHQQGYLNDALKFISWGDVWLTDPATGLYARLRKPSTYGSSSTSTGSSGTGTTSSAQPTAADRQALAHNPDEAAKLSAASGTALGAGGAQAASSSYPPFAPSPMPYVNGPMILAHRLICEETGKKSYCQRADQLASITLNVYQHFWMGPQFDFWYVRSMLEFAQHDPNPAWYGIAQTSAQSALRRAKDRQGLFLRTWYGKKSSAASAPKGSLQLHAANAALFAWMAALGR